MTTQTAAFPLIHAVHEDKASISMEKRNCGRRKTVRQKAIPKAYRPVEFVARARKKQMCSQSTLSTRNNDCNPTSEKNCFKPLRHVSGGTRTGPFRARGGSVRGSTMSQSDLGSHSLCNTLKMFSGSSQNPHTQQLLRLARGVLSPHVDCARGVPSQRHRCWADEIVGYRMRPGAT